MLFCELGNSEKAKISEGYPSRAANQNYHLEYPILRIAHFADQRFEKMIPFAKPLWEMF